VELQQGAKVVVSLGPLHVDDILCLASYLRLQRHRDATSGHILPSDLHGNFSQDEPSKSSRDEVHVVQNVSYHRDLPPNLSHTSRRLEGVFYFTVMMIRLQAE
jgi:hypothetical protein